MPGVRRRLLVLGGAWSALAGFEAAPQSPWLRYDPGTFADDCLAPDFSGPGCGTSRGWDEAPWLSASAALLPVDRREPEAPRLGYELAGLIGLDRGLTYRQPRARPDR